MSVDLLRSRLKQDIAQAIEAHTGVLQDGYQLPLDMLRVTQGRIDGLRQALILLDERYQNLHAMG
jgi:hypothetical protein